MLRMIEERPYLWCTYVWNMFDFAADGRDEGGVKGRNNKGLVTFDRKIKKESFYLYKAYWSEEPFVYITGRRFVNRAETETEVKVYSNQKEVSLYQNGKFVGSAAQSGHIFRFRITLEKDNELTAKAGETADSIVIHQADAPDPSYTMPVMEEITNWLDGVDIQLKEGYFTLDDRVEELVNVPEGEAVFLEFLAAYDSRKQGAGSSHINPTRLSSLKQSMEALGGVVSYYPAYKLNGDADEQAMQEAIAGAGEAEIVVLAVGLPDSLESEGYDRQHMQIPQSHQDLIQKAAEVNQNVVVVLMGGSPVEMPWIENAKAVLNLYLGGQAAGGAAAELLYGVVNPSGKLAETYPMCYADCSTSGTFGVNPRQAEYAESIYVGYRYYEKAGIPVRFPFGYGLSYTEFAYSGMAVSAKSGRISFAENDQAVVKVSCMVKNTGDRAGAEVVQLYVRDLTAGVFKAEKELKGFRKIFLEPGEEKEVEMLLDKRSFAHYDVDRSDWEVLTGTYEILLGASSADIRLREALAVDGTVEKLPYEEIPSWYIKPEGKPDMKDFEKIYGQEIRPYVPEKAGAFTMLNTFNDMKENPVVKQIMDGMKAGMLQGRDENDPEMIFTLSIVFNTPLVRLVQQGGGATPLGLMQAAVACANGDMSAVEQLSAMMGGK